MQTSVRSSWLRSRVSGTSCCTHWTNISKQRSLYQQGRSTPPGSPSIVLNTLRMEEANFVCPPFLISFEIFNCNVHNCMVDSGTTANVMPLSIAKNINAQWSKTSAQIIQHDRTSVLAIGELRNVIIRLSHDGRVHQCINIIVVDIPEAYGLMLSRD